jgi:hypothetical protein
MWRKISVLPNCLHVTEDIYSAKLSSYDGRCLFCQIVFMWRKISILPNCLHVTEDICSAKFSSCDGRYLFCQSVFMWRNISVLPNCLHMTEDICSSKVSSCDGRYLFCQSVFMWRKISILPKCLHVTKDISSAKVSCDGRHFSAKISLCKGKVLPLTGRRGPQVCETSRLPHFLDSRLTDGGEVVSLTRWPPFIPLGGGP